MEYLKEFKNITETTETLISIFIYNKKLIDVKSYFEDQLEKAKNISNIIKKQKINNRLFNFIKYLNTIDGDENQIMNNIILINDKTNIFSLTESEINTAKEFNFLNIFIKSNTYFYIDYFIDLFHNFVFIYTIKVNKNDMYIMKLNKNKDKELLNIKISNETKIIENIENIRKEYGYKDIIIICGESVYLGKIDNANLNNTVLVKTFLSKESCYQLYEDECMKKNIILLEKKLNELNDSRSNTDLFVFGKLKIEIKDAIESYLLKELYIETQKLDKLKNFIDDSFFNFKIIPIRSLSNGDSADQFIKNYNGIMGIKYY
jgi:hypothetical protein